MLFKPAPLSHSMKWQKQAFSRALSIMISNGQKNTRQRRVNFEAVLFTET
jgi:hypothetical protein